MRSQATVPALALALALCTPLSGEAAAFTIEQVLSAPFPSDLIAAPDGNRFAWVSDARGRRNVWLATPGIAGYE